MVWIYINYTALVLDDNRLKLIYILWLIDFLSKFADVEKLVSDMECSFVHACVYLFPLGIHLLITNIRYDGQPII